MNHENEKKESFKMTVRHEFDGIQEQDNDLPKWWVNMFILTIIFGACYLAWYHWPLGVGVTQAESFRREVLAMQEDAKARIAAQPVFDYATVVRDSAAIEAGKKTFGELCVPCHGANAQGSVGPNLTDDAWIGEPTLAAVEATISMGRLDKGMPAWGEIVGLEKTRQLVAFIFSVQGSNPAEAKAAQGTPGHLQ